MSKTSLRSRAANASESLVNWLDQVVRNTSTKVNLNASVSTHQRHTTSSTKHLTPPGSSRTTRMIPTTSKRRKMNTTYLHSVVFAPWVIHRPPAAFLNLQRVTTGTSLWLRDPSLIIRSDAIMYSHRKDKKPGHSLELRCPHPKVCATQSTL